MREERWSIRGFVSKSESLKLQDRARQLLYNQGQAIYGFEVNRLRTIMELERQLTAAEADYVEVVWYRANPRKGGTRKRRLGRACRAADQGSARAAAADQTPDLRFEQRKQEQIRRMRSAPVNPITPYTDAELAVIRQGRSKYAEEDSLNEAYALAHRRYHRGGKWTKPTRKQRFPVGPCSRAGISV